MAHFGHFISLSILTLVPLQAAANTDVVVFDNGDRLTGEVKSLERGLLRFKTDATGTIGIEWDEVAFVRSEQNIQVETEEGVRFLGHLLPSAEERRVVVETASGPFTLDAARVVKMSPIEDDVVSRIDGQLMAGFSYTKASEVQQLNFGLDLDYRTEIRILSLEADATTSDSADNESSQRDNLHLTYRRLRANRWLTAGLISLNRNDQLGLDLRTSIGAGVGRILRQTNSTNLMLEGGLTRNRENISGGPTSEYSWELYTNLSWDWFRYDLPELDLSTDLKVYPSLTESGRVRSELDITLRWEFIEDFFWSMSYYNSYDNKPSDPTASKSDYGVNTSVGWDF